MHQGLDPRPQTPSAGAPSRPQPSPEEWGGFVLRRREGGVLHVALTGGLSLDTLTQLDRRVVGEAVPASTQFLVLDATHLQHIPLEVARRLIEREREWRKWGVVAFWVGLSSYLTNLLVLAGGSESGPPALPDLDSVRPLLDRLVEGPASVARGRLEMCSSLVH